MAKFRLQLKRLDWISPVDEPAQQTARVILVKRRGAIVGTTLVPAAESFAPVMKLTETTDDDGNPIGLVFCWAFTGEFHGRDYYDTQGDNVIADDDMIRAALDYVKRGAKTDEMHDGRADGFTPFVMPMNAEIASAFFGKSVDTSGLMVGLLPSAEVFAKFKSGEYTGVSIEGLGERSKVARASKGTTMKCEKCASYMAKDAKKCPQCGAVNPTMAGKRSPFAADGSRFLDLADDAPIVCVELGKRAAVHFDAELRSTICKGVWSTATVDDLPDSSFLYVEAGGTKDSSGKTTPRSLRHFPYRDATGKIDIDHLRDAIGRIPQSSLPATLRNKLQVKAEKLLAKQHGDTSKRLEKRALLTTATDGHVHSLDDGGDAPDGETDWRGMPDEADGGWHSHPWVRSSDGTIVIGEAENHVHLVLEPDDIDAIVESNRPPDDDEDDAITGKRADISTPRTASLNAGFTREETMPDAKDTEIADLKKRNERLERLAKMSGAHKTHFDTLTGDDAEAFLAKSNADRQTVIDDVMKRAGEATAIVYTSKTNGAVFRKNDDPRMVEMAKREDAREEQIEKSEVASIAKSHLGQLAGEDAVHVFVVTACRKHAKELGADGAALLEKVQTAMKGWNALGADAKKAKGINPGIDPSGPITKAAAMSLLTAGLTKYVADNKLPVQTMWTDALQKFVQTPEGAALQKSYDDAAKQAQGMPASA